MRFSLARPALLWIISLALAFTPASGQRRRAQSGLLSAREAILAFPYAPSGAPCQPAQVQSVHSSLHQPPEILVAGVNFLSFSPKPIVAVRFRWDVFDDKGVVERLLSGCDTLSELRQPLTSGMTPVIKLEPLYEGETYTVSTLPPSHAGYHADKYLRLEHPLVTTSDIKSLIASGTRDKFKRKYYIALSVGEINYEDGTKWEPAGSRPSIIAGEPHNARIDRRANFSTDESRAIASPVQ